MYVCVCTVCVGVYGQQEYMMDRSTGQQVRRKRNAKQWDSYLYSEPGIRPQICFTVVLYMCVCVCSYAWPTGINDGSTELGNAC